MRDRQGRWLRHHWLLRRNRSPTGWAPAEMRYLWVAGARRVRDDRGVQERTLCATGTGYEIAATHSIDPAASATPMTVAASTSLG